MCLTTGHDSSICFLANSSNYFFVVVLFETWGGGVGGWNLIPSWFLSKCVWGLVLFFLNSADAWRLSNWLE